MCSAPAHQEVTAKGGWRWGGVVLRQGSCPQGGSWETEVPRSVGSPGPGSAGSSQERAGATSSGDSAPGGWGRWEEGPRGDANRLPVGGAPRRLRSRTGETDSRCEGLGTVVTPGEESGRV